MSKTKVRKPLTVKQKQDRLEMNALITSDVKAIESEAAKRNIKLPKKSKLLANTDPELRRIPARVKHRDAWMRKAWAHVFSNGKPVLEDPKDIGHAPGDVEHDDLDGWTYAPVLADVDQAKFDVRFIDGKTYTTPKGTNRVIPAEEPQAAPASIKQSAGFLQVDGPGDADIIKPTTKPRIGNSLQPSYVSLAAPASEAGDLFSGLKMLQVELPVGKKEFAWSLNQYADKFKTHYLEIINPQIPFMPQLVRGLRANFGQTKIECGKRLKDWEQYDGIWRHKWPVKPQWEKCYSNTLETAYRPYVSRQPMQMLSSNGGPLLFVEKRDDLADGFWLADDNYIYATKPLTDAMLSVRTGGGGYWTADKDKAESILTSFVACDPASHEATDRELDKLDLVADVVLANVDIANVSGSRDGCCIFPQAHLYSGIELHGFTLNNCNGHGPEASHNSKWRGVVVNNAGGNAAHAYGGRNDLELSGDNSGWGCYDWGWGASFLKGFPQRPVQETYWKLNCSNIFGNGAWTDFYVTDHEKIIYVHGVDIARDVGHWELSNKITVYVSGHNIGTEDDSEASGFSGAASRNFNSREIRTIIKKLTGLNQGAALNYTLQMWNGEHHAADEHGFLPMGYRTENEQSARPGGKEAIAADCTVEGGESVIARAHYRMPHKGKPGESMDCCFDGTLVDVSPGERERLMNEPSLFMKREGYTLVVQNEGNDSGTPFAAGHPNASRAEWEAMHKGEGTEVVVAG